MDKAEKKTNKKDLEVENKVQIAKSKQKVKKSKKNEKQIVVAARTGLEPRLSLPPAEQDRKEEIVSDIEKDKRLVVSLNINEIDEHLRKSNLKETPHLQSYFTTRNVNKKNKVSDIASISSLKRKKDIENNSDDEDFQNFIKKSKQQRIVKGLYWTDREIRDLAYGLQHHGFSDTDKLAAEVKTKTGNDIKVFLKSRIMDMNKSKASCNEKHRGRPKNTWTTVSHEVLQTWPSIRKWRRLAYEQMLPYTRTKDYSKPVISALCNKFYEEEPEPSDSQVINVKLIYKYISDCMAGVIPPQLPPKESALVLDLLREVRLMPIVYDFEEERGFLKDFRNATTFKPFQLKDEFKKKFKKAIDVDDPNTVSVPDEIFLELSRHKRLLQSFNPLITPVWMIQKEQEQLQQYFQESNVYVD